MTRRPSPKPATLLLGKPQPPAEDRTRDVRLTPLLLLSLAGTALTVALPAFPLLGLLRAALSAAAVWALFRARRRPAGQLLGGRLAGFYRPFWMLFTGLVGFANPGAGAWTGLLLGFFARGSLTPWVRARRSAALGLLLLTCVAAYAVPALLGVGTQMSGPGLLVMSTGDDGGLVTRPPAGSPAGAVRVVTGALYSLMQAWLLLAAVRGAAELLRRWIRRSSIRTKLVVAFGLFAITPAVLAVIFVGISAWVRSGEFRARALAEELQAHSATGAWMRAQQAGAVPASGTELAARLRGRAALFRGQGVSAMALERGPAGWWVAGAVGGPDSLFTPASAPVNDSGQVVRGLVLRAGGFHWAETAVWPRGGDSLALVTYEPVDTARLTAFGRQMRCDPILWGAPSMTSGSTRVSVSDRGTRVGVAQSAQEGFKAGVDAARDSRRDVRAQRRPGTRAAIPPAAWADSLERRRAAALTDSLTRSLGVISVGGGRFAGLGNRLLLSKEPVPGSDLPCDNWDRHSWRRGSAVLLARVDFWETAGLKGGGTSTVSFAFLIALWVVGALFLIVMLVAMMYGSRTAGFITRGVANLGAATARVQQGDFTARVTVPSEDELGELAGAFNRMAAGLEEGQRAVVEREHLRRELELARRIQARLLPAGPPAWPRLDVAAANAMSLQVGGDYFDFLEVAEGRIGFCVADVSGKGVGAALLMSNVKAALQAHAAAHASSAEIVGGVNRLLESSVETGKFVTLFLGVLDPASLTLEYVNAGHPAPILLRGDGSVERLETGGFVLGVMGDAVYEEGRVALAPGDVLALYTDGVNEAQGEGEELYGDERAEAVLRRGKGGSAADILSSLVADVRAFEGARGPSDDLTAMVLRVK
ncbi:MAG: SpoIIE family protein phosphatase [Candidatus Eisenbacteria bacterium]|nr:SpoIIE family protein phosphatase [Candidatus Eisenbacteria bacterium]